MKILTDLNPTPDTQEIVYNAMDTMQTMALKEEFDGGLIPDWAKVTYEFNEKMLGPVMTMMRRGVKIDTTRRDEVVAGLAKRIEVLQTNFDFMCEELFGTTINTNSGPQVKGLFYQFLGIPEQTKSKKGETKVSVDRDTMEKIAKEYPRGRVLANMIMRISDIGSQIEFLTKKLAPGNRFATAYNLAGTDTFRVSSSEHPLRYGCVPVGAEALTPNGWVSIINRPDNICQWNPETKELSFTNATWNIYPYHGMLQGYSGRCVRGSFTDNHKIPYYTSKQRFKSADAITVMNLSCASTPVSGILYDGEHKDPAWVRKFVMLSADGNEYQSGKWRVKVKKERKNLRCAYVLGCVPKVRASYGYFDYSGISGEMITKHFPDITKWDYASRVVFFDELKYWDAYIRGKSFIYYTTIKENADIVATAAHITGLSASIFINVDNSNKYGNTATKPLYSVNISTKQENKLESKRWFTEKYFGGVGCPTVETGFWLIRYRSGIYVTGNSNQQNIPRDDKGDARACFIADDGYLFFQADQQGAEARLVAYRSGDQNYIDACEGGDSHTMVAAMVFGIEPKREAAEQEYRRGISYRQTCKSGAHGSNYMGKPHTLAQQMGVETAIAEEFQLKYFKRFPGIKDWQNKTAELIQTVGYLENPFGMRRIFWDRKWDDATVRKAIAFYPQSGVGILTNIVLYKLWHKYEGQPGAPVQILMNGHDAVIGQIRADLAPTLIPEVLEEMKFPFEVEDIHGIKRQVVIPFDMEVGLNWGKYHPDKNPNGLKKWKPNEA